jgi:peptidoglycan/xylan/chitin deacetylase (PgdA/CDA1 family)
VVPRRNSYVARMVPAGRFRWPPILTYHAIAKVVDDPYDVCVSPEQFEAQMLYLKRHSLRGVSMRELLCAIRAGNTRGLVGLTFDDGYENLLQTALPVLESFGFSCTSFVLAGMLGEQNSWDAELRMELLGPDGIREVSERGMEVGSHGLNHLELASLDSEHLKQEVSGSRQILSEVLGKEVEGFCYPYGIHDGRVAQAVQRAGYAYGCAIWTWRRNVYTIPRIPVFEWDDPSFRFLAKLWAYSPYVKMRRSLAQGFGTLYRLSRRRNGG